MLSATRRGNLDPESMAEAHARAGSSGRDSRGRARGRSTMSTFLINGVEKQLPVSWESPLGALIQYAESHFNSDHALVTTFKVNGLEISAAEEVTLGGIPLSSLKTIEIETVHP